MNLAAAEALSEKSAIWMSFSLRAGGDNLSATFSPELADMTICD